MTNRSNSFRGKAIYSKTNKNLVRKISLFLHLKNSGLIKVSWLRNPTVLVEAYEEIQPLRHK